MITLYGTKGSGSAAIEAALVMAGVAYDIVEAVPWEASRDALGGVNALSQVPALRLADGTLLTESAAILIHLGLQHPDSGLLAQDPSARARQIRGLVYIAANCYAAIGILDYPDRWYPDPDADTRRRMDQRGRARLHELWDLFADQFRVEPWLSGREPGALDLLAAVVSRWAGARTHLETSRPAFSALLVAIDGDARVASVWQRHWPAAT